MNTASELRLAAATRCVQPIAYLFAQVSIAMRNRACFGLPQPHIYLDGLHVLPVAAVPLDPRRRVGAPHGARERVGAARRHRLLGGGDAGALGRD